MSRGITTLFLEEDKCLYTIPDKEGEFRTYITWKSIRYRTKHKPNKCYQNVDICERWNNYNSFLQDMGVRPGNNFFIDRIDNSKGYSPENCRWATRQQQMENRTVTRWLTYKDETRTITDWARILNSDRLVITARLDKLKWSVEKALTTPVRKFYQNRSCLIPGCNGRHERHGYCSTHAMRRERYKKMMSIPKHNSFFIGWNPNVKKEVEEAKTHYRWAKLHNRKILHPDEKQPIEHFNPNLGGFYIKEKELKDDELAFRFLDETGDRRLIWNMSKPEQVKESQTKFAEYLKKGWRAYAVGIDGKQGRRIFSFDAEREEVFFEEKGIGEKLKNFVKTVSEVRVVPRTYPG